MYDKKRGWCSITFCMPPEKWDLMNRVHKSFHFNKTKQMEYFIKEYFPTDEKEYITIMHKAVLNNTVEKLDSILKDNQRIQKELAENMKG